MGDADDSLDLLVRIKADSSGAEVVSQSLKGLKGEIRDGISPALAHFGETEEGVSKSAEKLHLSHRELHKLLHLLGPEAAEAGRVLLFGFGGPAVAGLAAVALAAGKVLGEWKKMQEAINTAVDLSGILKVTEALGREGMLTALTEGSMAAEEFWGKINRLGTAQESLKDKTDDATASIKKEHDANVELLGAQEKGELALLQVMEEQGRISKEKAARRKTEIQDRYAGQKGNRQSSMEGQIIAQRQHEREVDQRIVSEGPDAIRPKQIAADEARGRLEGQKAELEEWKKKLADIEKWLKEKGTDALGSVEGRDVYHVQEKARTLALKEIADREMGTIPKGENAVKETTTALAEAQRKVEEAQKRIGELNREISNLEADRDRDKATRAGVAQANKFVRDADTPFGRAAEEDVARAANTASAERASRKTGVRPSARDERQLIDVATRISGHSVSLAQAVTIMEGAARDQGVFTSDVMKLVEVMSNMAGFFKQVPNFQGQLDSIGQEVRNLQGQMAARSLNVGG